MSEIMSHLSASWLGFEQSQPGGIRQRIPYLFWPSGRPEVALSLAPWHGTPPDIARAMLRMAQVGPEDVVYDLGCGDARLLIMAVKEFGAQKAVGYEVRGDLCEVARQQIERENLPEKVTIIKGDLLEADVSEASVITLYLSSQANELLRPKLEKEAKSGTRIVSHRFEIKAWRITSQQELDDRHLYGNYGSVLAWGNAYHGPTVYLYIVPEAFAERVG